MHNDPSPPRDHTSVFTPIPNVPTPKQHPRNDRLGVVELGVLPRLPAAARLEPQSGRVRADNCAAWP